MALQKEFISEEGVSVNYWKITGTSFIKGNGKFSIFLSGYISKEARSNLKLPVMIKEFISDFEIDDKESMYIFIKTQEEFIDAVDVLEEMEDDLQTVNTVNTESSASSGNI
jgi:hypothetical protein